MAFLSSTGLLRAVRRGIANPTKFDIPQKRVLKKRPKKKQAKRINKKKTKNLGKKKSKKRTTKRKQKKKKNG